MMIGDESETRRRRMNDISWRGTSGMRAFIPNLGLWLVLIRGKDNMISIGTRYRLYDECALLFVGMSEPLDTMRTVLIWVNELTCTFGWPLGRDTC